MTADRLKIMLALSPNGVTARLESALTSCGFDVIHPTDVENLQSSLKQHHPDLVLLRTPAFASALEDLNATRIELAQSRANLEDRKLIERAKGLLMQQRGLSEPEAYRTLQKLAMDRKRKLAEVARNVLDMAELFTDKSK